MDTRLRRLLIPLLLITLFLGSLHWFILQVTLPDIPVSMRGPITWLAMVGVLSFPFGLILSHGPWRQLLKPVTVFSYFWLGYFFMNLTFAMVQFLVSFWIQHSYSYWPILAATLTGVISVVQAIRPPRIMTHQLAGPACMRGVSLVQISDLHVGMPLLDETWLAKQVDRINELQPDFVAVTGDLADGPFAIVSPALAPLANLKPKQKKFYITGNHEYIRGGDWERRLHELGFTVLHNSNQIFQNSNGQYLIAGVPDPMVGRFGGQFESLPQKALWTPEKVDYRILLAHQPNAVFQLQGEKCDLLLAGHTHGGQIFPFAMFVRLQQPVAAGFKKINDVLVFAHMGTGYWGPPMRWMTSSEIVRFQWGKNEV